MDAWLGADCQEAGAAQSGEDKRPTTSLTTAAQSGEDERTTTSTTRGVDDSVWGILRFDTFIVQLRGDGASLGRCRANSEATTERHGKVAITV